MPLKTTGACGNSQFHFSQCAKCVAIYNTMSHVLHYLTSMCLTVAA